MSDIMSDKQSFFLFGERVVFGKKTIDEQLLNPKILFLRGIIRKKPFQKKYIVILISILLAAILATVLYICLKSTVFLCDCFNNASCTTFGVCICKPGYSGNKCQNYDICWDNPCKGEGQCFAFNQTYFECSCGNKFSDSTCHSNYQYPIDLLLELNNNQIASQFSNKSIKIWSKNFTESFFINLKPIRSRISSMNQIINNNEQLLLVGTCDSHIQVLNISNQFQYIQSIKTYQDSVCVNALAVINFEQDNYLVSASGNILQIWNFSNSDIINVANVNITHDKNIVTNLAFNPNSSMLISSADRSINVWNVASFQSINISYMSNCSGCLIYSFTLLPNGNIVSGSTHDHDNGNLYVWDKKLSLIKILNNSYDYALSLITLENDMFAVGYGNYQIDIWNSSSLELIITLDETGTVWALAMLQNGNLVSASSDVSGSNYRISIWDMATFNLTASWAAHRANILSLAILPNQNIVSGSQDNIIKIWDQKNFTLIKALKVYDTVYSLAVLHDGNLAAGIAKTLSFWNMTSFQLIANLDSHISFIYTLKTMPDGSVLSGSGDGTVKIWKNYELINTLNTKSETHSLLVLDNLNFLAGNSNNTIQLWQKNNNISNIINLITLSGHTDKILTLAFLNNTYYLASGSRDLTIIIWDLLQLTLYKTLTGHTNYVTSLVNLPNYKFASGSMDKTILIWDIEQLFKSLYSLNSHLGGINSLIYLNEQKNLMSSSQDVTSIIWNTNTDLVLKYQLVGHSLSVQDITELNNGTLVSCSNDLNLMSWNYISNLNYSSSFKTNHYDYMYAILFINNLIATSSKDLTVKIWNNSNLIATLYGHLKPVISLLALSDQTLLASGSCDETIKIWNLTSFNLVRTLNGHKGCVNTLSLYGPQIILSGSSDSKIIVWNMTNNFEIVTYLDGHGSEIKSIDTYDDRLIASGSQDSTIKIWSSSYRVSQTLISHTDSVYGLAILNNGNLVSGSMDNNIKIWDKNTFKLLNTLGNHTGTIFKLAVLKSGLLVSGAWDNSIIIYNNSEIVKIINDHTDYISGLIVLNNGNFVSCSFDYTVRIWDKVTFENLTEIKIFNYGISQPSSLQGLQNDTGIAFGDTAGNIYILDPNTLNVTRNILNAHISTIWALTILSNGNLVSGSADKFIKIWNTITLSFIKNLVGHESYIYSLVSINSNILLSGSADNTIRIWSTDTFDLMEICTEHSSIVTNLVVFQDGSFASASEDNTIKIWKKNDFQNVANLTGHFGTVSAVRFLKNGLLASASLDRSIKLWEMISFSNIATRKNAHSKSINSLKTVLKSTKNYLISSSEDRSIKIWDTDIYLNMSRLI